MSAVVEQAFDWGTRLEGSSITYAFAPAGGAYESIAGVVSGYQWYPYEKAQVTLALSLFERFLAVTFVEAAYDASPDLVFISADSADLGGSLGFFAPPGTAYAGIGAFNWQGEGWDWQEPGKGALEQGGFGFVTILHEIGHALGLAHPHDAGGASAILAGVDRAFGDYGTHDLNQGIYTTMSYNDGWRTNPFGTPGDNSYGLQGTPMAIDIAVLQGKYGTNRTYRAGDDVYELPDGAAVGTFYASIWDAGGDDWIVYGGAAAVVIDLRAATLALEPGGGGFVSHVRGASGGFTIARGVVIENAAAGSGDDMLTGNASANEIRGRSGKDEILGRSGADSLYGGRRSDDLSGGSGDDVVKGGGGRDKVRGGDGNDHLIGGKGRDRLIGGEGRDAFVFDVRLKAKKADVVRDFDDEMDELWLDSGTFKKIGPAGVLKTKAFHAGKAAKDDSDRIIYKEAAGKLYYDPDGVGGRDQKLIAKFAGGADLSHDVIIVA